MLNRGIRKLSQPPMVISNGSTLTTTIDVVEDGTYTVELLCIDGFNNEIPIEYIIRAIPDAVPEVVVKEPGRDIKTTKLGEVEIVAEATDDYGIGALKLIYRVGSNELQELVMESSDPLVASGAVDAVQRRVAEGRYTFYLEEFDVEPGDIISYYAHAVDNNTLTGPGEASSDIYFIEIRPFNENFQEAEGEPASPMPNPLRKIIGSQKQIIRETSNHINAKPSSVTEEYRSTVKQTADKQTKLRDETQKLADEFSTAMQGESAITPEILMNLEDAIAEMGEAADSLNAVQPTEAIPSEQEALQLLIKVSLELPNVLMQMRNSNPQLAENLELEMEELENELEDQQNELDAEMQEQTQEMLESSTSDVVRAAAAKSTEPAIGAVKVNHLQAKCSRIVSNKGSCRNRHSRWHSNSVTCNRMRRGRKGNAWIKPVKPCNRRVNRCSKPQKACNSRNRNSVPLKVKKPRKRLEEAVETVRKGRIGIHGCSA